MPGEVAIGYEIGNFASVMTSRQRSFDEELGTNNYLTDTDENKAVIMLKLALEKLEHELECGNRVNAKVYAVDVANCAHIVWTKL